MSTGFEREPDPMTSKASQLSVAVGAALVIAASFYSLCSLGRRPDVIVRFHANVGRMMAKQTADLLGNQGQVVVLALDPAQSPVCQAQLDGFRRALRECGGIRIVQTIFLQPKGEEAYGLGHGLSAEDFLKVLDHYRHVAAIVSFVGVPSLRSEQIRKLSATRPVFVAEAKFGERLRRLLDHHVVQVAVVPRFLPRAPEARSQTDAFGDRFGMYFEVLKAPAQSTVASESARAAE